MTEIKQLSLSERLRIAAACPDPNAPLLAEAAFAIERHESFRQEVSDAVEGLLARETPAGRFGSSENLRRFIIAKPDPLVEALEETGDDEAVERAWRLRNFMAKRGYEWRKIVWGEG